MDSITIGLIVAAAIVHATWNLLAKRASGGVLYVWAYSAAMAILYAPLAIWVLCSDETEWTLLAIGAVIVSGILHIGYSLTLQTGYQRADLSVVYPIARGTGPAFSVAGAILLLGEPFTSATLIGAALVVAGVLVIGLNGTRPHGSRIWTGIGWGAFTGLFIAAYTLNDGAAVRLLALSPILLDYGGNLVRLICLTPIALRRRDELTEEVQRTWRFILAAGVLMPIPYNLVLFAMMRAPISVVAPARELSMMVGVIFGWWLLKEADVVRRLAGVAAIAAGVVMLLG